MKSPKRCEVHLPKRPRSPSGLFATVPGEAPAGQDMRKRHNILLRVAAIHPHRLEFHQLARVIFVNALELPFRVRAVRRAVLPVVEVEEHRGMAGGRAKQCAELA